MSRVLVVAGAGMLGHTLVRVLGPAHRVGTTIRDLSAPDGLFEESVPVYQGIDLRLDADVDRVLDAEAWDVVVNAAGVIKQRTESADPVQTIAVNALLPHRLAQACGKRGIRLIHFSTDCVFSGSRDSKRGPNGYRESDPTDAHDLYGTSKRLGEVTAPGSITIRTSLIGPEFRGGHGLLSWFLNQSGKQISGYTNALFTGLSTRLAASLVNELICNHPDLSGLWQASTAPISKYDLLQLFRQRYGMEVDIRPDPSLFCDRRLDGSAFHSATHWTAPAWEAIVDDMASRS
jgi:dTDP-4-dehydrorhamnose reductase